MTKTRFQVGDRVRTGAGEGTIQAVEKRADGIVYLIAYDDGLTIPLSASIVDAQAQAEAQLEFAQASDRVGATLGGLVVLVLIIFALSRCGGEKPSATASAYRDVELDQTYGPSPGGEQIAEETATESEPTTSSRSSGSTGEHLDVDRLTTYAVVLGRASGCGINITSEGKRVGAWLNRVTQPGPEQDSMNMIFMSGIVEHRDAQMAGRSPDTCDQVRQSFARFEWP